MKQPRAEEDEEEIIDVGEENGANCVVRPIFDDPQTVHEQLVSYVHALNADEEPRLGVIMEHSYANNGVTPSMSEDDSARSLLVRRPRHKSKTPPGDTEIDVVTCDAPPVYLPDPPPEIVDEPDIEEDDWETKLQEMAPTQLCKTVVDKVIKLFHSFRLSRMCGAGGARDETRTHARRFRRLLAPLWIGPPSTRAASWLHAALVNTLPPHYQLLYEEMLAELRRVIPRLCDRLLAQRLPSPAPEPCPKPGPAVMPMSSRPLLVWIGSGREKHDARWERRLRALVPTHYLRLHSSESRTPESWCAAVTNGARASLAALDAGPETCSLLALGGIGAGATLAAQLAIEDSRVGALVMLAPPLHTPDADRDTPDDPLQDLRIPCLMVIPECASTIWWELACGAAVTGRKLLVGGTDDDLNLSHRTRRTLRLPQHALDAAIVDECARWLNEVNEDGALYDNGGTPPPPKKNKVTSNWEVANADYSHLPPVAPRTIDNTVTNHSAKEIVGGIGEEQLSTPPPPPPPPPPQPQLPATIDIMSMPIVFADDEPTVTNNTTPSVPPPLPRALPPALPRALPPALPRALPTPPPMFNVSTGCRSLKYTKVIVAKRGGGSGPNRPIVFRGGVRLLARTTTARPR